MVKIVRLNLEEEKFKESFRATLEIGEDGALATEIKKGYLPAAPHIIELLKQWQTDFFNKVQRPSGEPTKHSSTGSINRNNSCRIQPISSFYKRIR